MGTLGGLKDDMVLLRRRVEVNKQEIVEQLVGNQVAEANGFKGLRTELMTMDATRGHQER